MKTLWNQLSAHYIREANSPSSTIHQCLGQPQIQALLAQADREKQYPISVRQILHVQGLSRLLANSAEDPLAKKEETPLTMWHAVDLLQSLASTSGTIVITVSVNYLALMPAYIAGTEEQLRWLFGKVHEGNFAAMLLSEAAHGSDLRQNETSAKRQGRHYCLTGEKGLINGGSQHELLMVLAKVDETAFDFFMVERDETVTKPKRWATLPMPGADISSVRFEQMSLPLHSRLGSAGSGFNILQKAFTFTRGGIAGMNAGISQRAVNLATEYAQTRQLYGKPILHLGAIADHLLKMKAMHWLLLAMTHKTTAVLNTYGAAATYHASIAKVGTSQLAEQIVNEGRLLHGARGLLVENAFHQLVRDVPLFGTFDGTSHVVLAQIETRLAQMVQMTPSQPGVLLEMMQAAYRQHPVNLVQVARQRKRPLLIPLPNYLEALTDVVRDNDLSPVTTLASFLWGLVAHSQKSGLWATDQGWRFALADQAVRLEMLVALVETADSGAYQLLSGQPIPELFRQQQPVYNYAFGWFGSQIAADIRQLAYQCNHALPNDLRIAEQSLSTIARQARTAIQQNLEILIS